MRAQRFFRVNVVYTSARGAEATDWVDVEASDIAGAIESALGTFAPTCNALAVKVLDSDGYEIWDSSSDNERG